LANSFTLKGKAMNRSVFCKRFSPVRPNAAFKMAAVLFLLLAVAFAGSACAPKRQVSPAAVDQAQTTIQLAEALMSEAKYRQALQRLNEAKALDDRDPKLYYNYGLVYLALEQPELAAEQFKQALRKDPNYSAAKNNLGLAYGALGQWDKAIPLFEELAANLLYVNPQQPMLNLGWIYFNKKEYEKSAGYYLKAIEYQSDYAQAWRGLGRTYLAMGRINEAAQALEKAVEIAPFFAGAMLDLGQAYQALGLPTKARQAWQRAADVEPTSKEAAEARAMLERSSR
jgi:Tfp pilus assembly protein PilF